VSSKKQQREEIDSFIYREKKKQRFIYCGVDNSREVDLRLQQKLTQIELTYGFSNVFRELTSGPPA